MSNKKSSDQLSAFLTYLAAECQDGERLPPLANLAQQLGMSIASLREQLEVARSMGVVEVRPKTGIRKRPYCFKDSIQASLAYAVEVSPGNFSTFSDLRRQIESAYWYQAVIRLTPEDHLALKALVQRAYEKLSQTPPQIPHFEHRELHLIMYRRLENTFVYGLLEAFWETYEAVGLDTIVEMEYLQHVWHFHHKIVEAICLGDYETGHDALREHMDLLNQRPKSSNNQQFE